MPLPSKQHVLKFLLPAAVLAVVSGAAVLAFVQPQAALSTTINPQTTKAAPSASSAGGPTGQSSPGSSPMPGSSPAMAGESTTAPQASPRPGQASARPTAASGPGYGSSGASTSALNPGAVAQLATVTVTAGGKSSSFSISPTGVNACTILERARDAGKISSVTITDKYVPTLQSLFVEEINGFRDNWTYKLNGQTASWGCSNPRAPILKAGDAITWTQG